MQWIDVNEEAVLQDARRGVVAAPGRTLGVCYRSECHRFRVAADDLAKPAEEREWSLWDMTGAAPIVLMAGFKSQTVAMRAGDGVGESRGLRIVLRLAAIGRVIGRAAAAGVRRLTA